MAAHPGLSLRFPGGAVPPVVGFAAAGAVGFLVDATLCKLLIGAGMPALLARVPAILTAMSVTFLLNRTITFRAHGPLLPQAWRYFAVNAAGATFNYTVFAVALLATHGLMPLAAVVAGCGAGAAVNFLGASTVAFPASQRR
jgi:putative flippase GtrA